MRLMVTDKKIVFVIDSMGKGGAERVMSILANHFSNQNEIYIVTLINDKVDYQLNDSIKIIKLSELVNQKQLPILKKIFLPIRFMKKYNGLKKLIKNINPDLIISFLPDSSFLSVLANKKKCKLLISDRNDPKIEYKKALNKLFMKKLYPKADAFVFQTADAKEYFNNIINFNKKDYKVIFNPVNPKFIRERYNGIRKKEIVTVGRLSEQKNHNLLIDSFDKIKDKYPDYVLKIYGDGELREELQEKISDLNLTHRVLLQGVANNVEKEIYDSDLFILSSNYEGMPNALIEAMCLGLTVVSTDCPCGGPKSLINDKNGILVPVNDEKKLMGAIDKVLSNAELRNSLGSEASNISKLVNPNVILSEWNNLIAKVIGDE